MNEPGDPSRYEREQYERLYLAFCGEHYLDPEDTQSAIRFEAWFEDWIEEVERR